MKEMGQTYSELDKKAKDTEQWRKLVLALCASGRNKEYVGRYLFVAGHFCPQE